MKIGVFARAAAFALLVATGASAAPAPASSALDGVWNGQRAAAAPAASSLNGVWNGQPTDAAPAAGSLDGVWNRQLADAAPAASSLNGAWNGRPADAAPAASSLAGVWNGQRAGGGSLDGAWNIQRTAAASPAAGLNGVWYGLRADGITGKVKVDHYTFLADGRAFRGFPTEGLGQPVDMEYECRYAECGRYTRQGDQIVFRTTTGFDTAFTVDAQGVLRKPKSTQGYRPMHLLDGVRLSGTWGVFDPDGGAPVVTISFTPDGRFREAGLLNYTAWAKLGPDPASRKAVERGVGTYAVRRGTLELRYDGGPVARFMIATPPAVPPGPTAKTLQVGGATLDRAP